MSERENNKLVEVFSSTDSTQVHLAASLLESEGLFVLVEDEYVSRVLVMSSGVTLLVFEDDAKRALALLEEAGYIPSQGKGMMQDAVEERKRFGKRIGSIVALILLVLALLALSSWFTAEQMQ